MYLFKSYPTWSLLNVWIYNVIVFNKHEVLGHCFFKYSFWPFCFSFPSMPLIFAPVFDGSVQVFEALIFLLLPSFLRLNNFCCSVFKFVDSSVNSPMLLNIPSSFLIHYYVFN